MKLMTDQDLGADAGTPEHTARRRIERIATQRALEAAAEVAAQHATYGWPRAHAADVEDAIRAMIEGENMSQDFRELAAIAAMTALIAKSEFQLADIERQGFVYNSIAAGAFSYADAMVKMRERDWTSDDENYKKVSKERLP